MDDDIKGKIEALAFGGQGLVKENQLITFIPYTAVGDTLTYTLEKKKKNFAFGKLKTILTPGPDRIDPLCPFYGPCSGCQLQHINYKAQLHWKRQWVMEALTRIAGLKNPHVEAIRQTHSTWGYRRRISLTLLPHKDSYKIGYMGRDEKKLVEIDECRLFVDPSDTIVKEVIYIAKQFKRKDETEAKVTLLKVEDKQYIVHFNFKMMPENAKEILEKEKGKYPSILSLQATSATKSIQDQNVAPSFQFEELTFNFSPQAFIQNHPQQSLSLYQEIFSMADKIKPKTVLDLYSGIGVMSCVLAKKGCQVIGVEASKAAVALANQNAKQNHLTSAQFKLDLVEKALEALIKDETKDLILLNPPREGVDKKALDLIVSSKAKHLIYISCMPATLARDLKEIKKSYQIESIIPFDMFPQTTHVETVVYCCLIQSCHDK